MAGPVLEIAHLSKFFGDVPAVRDLSFRLEPGQVLGFLGPNGAGKTTTLRMIVGIVKADAGTIHLFGEPQSRSMLHRIGYLPEERGLYRRMKVGEAVTYFARLKGLDKAAARRRAYEMLERLGLSGKAGRRIETLSKGLAQKAQLAAAIAHGPELLILDEPFTGLDPLNQQTIATIIRDEASKGRSIVFSTHNMQHAEHLCGEILILREGEAAFSGTVEKARRLLPRRVRLEATEDLSFLNHVAGVSRLVAPTPSMPAWEAVLANGTEPGVLLGACVARGTTPSRFDASEPTLHEVFVAIAGGSRTPERDSDPEAA